MLRGNRVLGVAVAVAVAVSLAGCAAPVTQHSSAPSQSAAAPSPTPTPTQAAVPVVRVPVSCAAILDSSTAASRIGGRVAFSSDESTIPKDMQSVAERQYGSLDCMWAASNAADGAFDPAAFVTIAPDAADAYNHSVPEIVTQSGETPTLKSVAGDESEITCSVDSGLNCSANMLVGQYWTSVILLDGSGKSVAAGDAQLKPILVKIAGLLGSAHASPAWNPPGALPTFCSNANTAKSVAAINSAFGTKGYVSDPGETVAPQASTWPLNTADYSSCGFTKNGSQADSHVGVSLLQGGAWAMTALLANTAEDGLDRGPFTTVNIPSMGTAAYSCAGETLTCDALVADGSNLFEIDLGGISSTAVNPDLIKVANAIASAN